MTWYDYDYDHDRSVVTINLLKGKKIIALVLDRREPEAFVIATSDATVQIYDAGQDCCEKRSMTCDDDLASFVGATFLDCIVEDGPESESEDQPHETKFVRISTDRGVIVLTAHNEHNGYYGGFQMKARLT